MLDDTVLIIYSRHAADVLDGLRGQSSSGDRSEVKISPCRNFGNKIAGIGERIGEFPKISEKNAFVPYIRISVLS